MFHKEVLNISFSHRKDIKKIFGEILGIDDIVHFSLDLVNPIDEMLFFSSTPAHGYEICKRGLGIYDGIISSEYYKNFEFYWWCDASHKAYAEEIKQIREGLLGLKNGFMLVRRWNDFHLIYSFATKKSDPYFQTTIINKVNNFLKMGDHAYSLLRNLYCDYSGDYKPPKIERFYAFEGGMPPARYTKDYKECSLNKLCQTQEDNTKCNSKIVVVDFSRKALFKKEGINEENK